MPKVIKIIDGTETQKKKKRKTEQGDRGYSVRVRNK